MNTKASEVGWFNVAVAYRESAQALVAAKDRVGHVELPIRLLFYHAIELFLKTFLVMHGYSEKKLKDIGHRPKDLADAAVAKGLEFDDEDLEVIGLMAEPGTVIEARYLRIGPVTWPAIEALDRTAKSLFENVRQALRAAGHKLR